MDEIVATDIQARISDWKADGYAIRENLLSPEVIDRLLQGIATHAAHHTGATFFLRPAVWREQAFHDRLTALRSERPDAFSAIYTSMQSSVLLTKALTGNAILEAVAECLECAPERLLLSSALLRMDPPKDTRNVLGWHQEQSYNPLNRNGDNAVTVWIPLQDTPAEQGAIWGMPGSHREGEVPNTVNQQAGGSTSFEIDGAILDRYKATCLPLRAGSGLIFGMYFFHASGHNTMSRIRFTARGRYHRLDEDYVPGRQAYIPA
jgi:hypothetical protein